MRHVKAVSIPRYAVSDDAKRGVKFPFSLLFPGEVSQENWTLLSKLGMTY